MTVETTKYWVDTIPPHATPALRIFTEGGSADAVACWLSTNGFRYHRHANKTDFYVLPPKPEDDR